MMSDVNKIVAAILTAGRIPTFTSQPQSMDDWLAEYEAWIDELEKKDKAEKERAAAEYIASLDRR